MPDPMPESKPDVLIIPREQEPGDDFARVYSNQSPKDDSRTPSKTIVISGVSDQIAKEQPQHVMQAVINAVQSQFKQDMANGVIKESNATNSDIPDVIFSEPVREVNDQQSVQQQKPLPQQQQQQDSSRSSPEVVEKVYKLPVVTRMISREEETNKDTKDVKDIKYIKDVNIKRIPLWRSPIPFLHNECMHSMDQNKRKPKYYRKKGIENTLRQSLSIILTDI
jgi:hypothetical protein